VHQSTGDRPKVGKLFDVRGSESVAAFFSVNPANVSPANANPTRVNSSAQGPTQIAGLIIVTKVTSDRVEAGLITDDAGRFPKTLGPMLKMLFAAWHPLQATDGNYAGAAQLRNITLSDNSATLGLPEGWRLVPKMSKMGSAVAIGPHDEAAELGIAFLASDPNNPNVQRTLDTLRQGGLRGTAYANATYYPYGGDFGRTYEYMMQDLRRRANLSKATYNFTSVQPTPGSGQERCAHLTGTVDFNDGKGPRILNAVYCMNPPGRFGNWMSAAYMTTVPRNVEPQERATLGAILASFNVNMRVVDEQAGRIAAPAIEQIHAIGRAAALQAQQAHQMEDIHNSCVYQHWDSMDKRSQEFENYQLGYTVISTTDHSAHGTFWNEDADDLVKNNPDKYEYVSAPNYWKGIDY
jgi:hypothetical protein